MIGIQRCIARLARAAASVTAIALVVLTPVTTTGCGGGSDDGTGPSASLCSSATWDDASIGFNLGCSSYEVNVSGITYDQFSRVTSYNYDISCTGGSNRRAGRVYNISHNDLGQPLTWDFTINGETCHRS